MAEGTELAKAYVQIIPSAKGISGAISEEMGGEAEAAGKDAGNRIASGIKKIIMAAGLGKLIKDSLSAGADLQQSIGGIETLFGTGGRSVEQYAEKLGKSVEEVTEKYSMLEEAQSLALENANKAYQTAGLSANDYMQTVTSFAAALKGSTENELTAARAADQAVIDMADNANKMGTDMGSIQAAYQGFAKQNYTMLDNLKLGYGGTKTEMERLLKDASKLSGVKYDINNLSDVYSAIHVIQDQLDITGTTAKEAASTFSGSMASMKAAGQNVLAALSLGQDVGPALQGLLDSVTTFIWDNAIPMIGNVLKSLPDVLIGMLDWADSMGDAVGGLLVEAVEGGVKLLSNAVPRLIKAAVGALSGIVGGITSMDWSEIIPSVLEGISGIITAIGEAVPTLMQAGAQVISFLVEGILTAIPQLLTAIPQIVTDMMTALTTAGSGLLTTGNDLLGSVIAGITEALPNILQTGLDVVTELISGLLDAVPGLLETGTRMLTDFLGAITDTLPQVLDTGTEILMGFLDGIMDALPDLLARIPEIIVGIINTITNMIPKIVETGVKLLTSLVQKLPQIISTIIPKVFQIVTSIITGLASKIPDIVQAGFNLLVSLITELPKIIIEIVKAVPQIVKGLVNGFKEHAGEMLQAGKDMLLGLGKGIGDAIGGVVAKAKEAAGKVLGAVKNFFGIHSPSTVFAGIGEMLDEGLAKGIEGNVKPVQDAIDDIASVTSQGFETDVAISANRAAANMSLDAAAAGSSDALEAIYAKLAAISEYLQTARLKMVMDTGQLVGAIAPAMDNELGVLSIRTGRGSR